MLAADGSSDPCSLPKGVLDSARPVDAGRFSGVALEGADHSADAGMARSALAAVSLVGTGTLVRGAMFPISSLTMLLFRVWVLVLAALLLRRTWRAVPATPNPALGHEASVLSYR